MNVLKTLAPIVLAVFALACATEEPATETETATETVAADPSAMANPCSLITEAEATEALGGPSTFRSAEDGSTNCIIDPTGEAGGVSVDFRVTTDENAWENEAGNAETISGLGDVAVWNGSAIAVKKGDQYLIAHVSRIGSETVDLRQRAVAFAEMIVPKI